MSRRAGYIECSHAECQKDSRVLATLSSLMHQCCGSHECEEQP